MSSNILMLVWPNVLRYRSCQVWISGIMASSTCSLGFKLSTSTRIVLIPRLNYCICIFVGKKQTRPTMELISWICHTGLGHRLLSLCSEFGLFVTNTLFQLKYKHKTTWMHSRSKHWHLLDYVLVKAVDLQDVQITRVMRGAECWTDHRLVRTSLRSAYAFVPQPENRNLSVNLGPKSRPVQPTCSHIV